MSPSSCFLLESLNISLPLLFRVHSRSSQKQKSFLYSHSEGLRMLLPPYSELLPARGAREIRVGAQATNRHCEY